jgi:hypothetical protein
LRSPVTGCDVDAVTGAMVLGDADAGAARSPIAIRPAKRLVGRCTATPLSHVAGEKYPYSVEERAGNSFRLRPMPGF